MDVYTTNSSVGLYNELRVVHQRRYAIVINELYKSVTDFVLVIPNSCGKPFHCIFMLFIVASNNTQLGRANINDAYSAEHDMAH